MLPKEHGAYGQIAFPLITAFVVAGVSVAGALIAMATVAGFLAHEPLSILLGLRGQRARRELGARATRWLACWGIVGVAAGIGALAIMQPAARWSLLVPLVPALLLTVAIVQGREKTTFGEVTTAIAFAGVAVPVVLAAGRTWPVAAIVAVPFALSFIAGTLAVRVVILRVRGGGDPRAMRHTRHAAFGLVACATAALAIATGTSVLPAAVLIAAAPGLLMGAAIAARPPAPSRLRTIGWTLVAVSFLTAFTIIAGAA